MSGVSWGAKFFPPPNLNGTESRIGNRTIPRIAYLESPDLPQREAQQMSRIAGSSSRIVENRFRIAIRIASYLLGIIQSLPKGAGKMVPREICRKVSKNFLTLFDDFWRFLPCAKDVEKCRKTFWHFLTIFDVFDVAPFHRPLLQSAK